MWTANLVLANLSGSPITVARAEDRHLLGGHLEVDAEPSVAQQRAHRLLRVPDQLAEVHHGPVQGSGAAARPRSRR